MKEIVKQAYRLFKNYSVQSPLDICTDCCMDKEDEELLASLKVKDIPKSLLMEYNDGGSAQKTPIEELKHFLPRYVELVSDFNFPSHSTEIAFRRLEPFERDEWTDEELLFLEKFALGFFNKCLSIYPLPENEVISGILIMFWRGQFQLTELLNSWSADQTLSSTLHFKDLCLEGFKQKNPSKMTNGFGEEEISKFLRNWVDEKAIRMAFRKNIEKLIMDDTALNDVQSYEIDILYEMLNTKQ